MIFKKIKKIRNLPYRGYNNNDDVYLNKLICGYEAFGPLPHNQQISLYLYIQDKFLEGLK
jgi:hypothetical protein